MRTHLVVAGLILGLFAFTAKASATPFGVEYNGGVFTIEVISGSLTGDDFVIRYTADLTNFTGDEGRQLYLYGIGFRPSSSPASSGDVTPLSGQPAWTFLTNELSANGCRNGSDSFDCYSTWNGSILEGTGLTTLGDVGAGPVYVWDFHLLYPTEVTLDLAGQSIKAAFSSDSTGASQTGLMSLTTHQVPEPGSTLLLLGTGLAMLGVARRWWHR